MKGILNSIWDENTENAKQTSSFLFCDLDFKLVNSILRYHNFLLATWAILTSLVWISYSYKLTVCNPYNLYVLRLIGLIYLFMYNLKKYPIQFNL